MTTDASKRRPKSGAFPGKFRSFVNDVKKFRVHRHERRDSEGPAKESSPAPLVSLQIPSQTSLQVAPQATPQITPQTSHVLETEQVSSSQSSLPVASLAVQVTITFDDPLNYSYTRNYETSPSLEATEALCQGLLRRVDHCCYELITRKDSTAMEYAAASGPDKPLRYEIQIDIIRGWSEIWASRTFKSYQKQLLSTEAARDVILATHHIIGLFLRHHDEGFVWKDGPVREDPSEEQAKFPHRAGRVQPMSCVPRSYFLEKSQSFESLPGYTISFSFTSRCQRRKPLEWHKEVEVNSSQTAPLNSIGAESLFFEASYALEGVLRSERRAFQENHNLCASLDGCKDCRHHDNDGVDLRLSVTNNIGPQFPHLERSIHCNSNLSFHSDTQECLRFVNGVEAALGKVRDDADGVIGRMNDLEFRITELRGNGWSLNEPLVFSLDSSSSHSRRSVQAILDRIQAGVADILRGNAISVRMTAHKRGHFILDKTFVAREPLESDEKKRPKSAGKPKDYVLNRLRQRIERDIEMICKDTLTIEAEEEVDNATEKAPLLEQTPRIAPPSRSAGTSTLTVGRKTTDSTSKDVTGQREDPPRPKTAIEVRPITPIAKTPAETTIFPASHFQPTRYAHSAPPSPKRRPPIPMRRSSLVIYYSQTGARAFPLVPLSDNWSYPGSLDKNADEKKLDGDVSDHKVSADNLTQKPTALTSHQSVLHDTKGPEEKGLPVATNSGEESEPAPVYEPSTASSTPSLVFGGESSPSSSLLITPKNNRLSPEIGFPRHAIVDSDDEDIRDPVSISIEVQHDLVKGQLFHTPNPRLAAKPASSSPLRLSQSVQEPADVDLPKSVGELLTGNAECDGPNKEQESPLAAEAVETPSVLVEGTPRADVLSASSTDEGHMNTGKDAASTHDIKENTDLPSPITAETPEQPKSIPASECQPQNTTTKTSLTNPKPDFLVSFPRPTTPNIKTNRPPNQHDQDSPAPLQRETSPDPSEDMPSSTSTTSSSSQLGPPSQPQAQRGSFGSAGILGFHEQMFGSLSLRTALMRSRPSSNFDIGGGGGGDSLREEKRPGTAV